MQRDGRLSSSGGRRTRHSGGSVAVTGNRALEKIRLLPWSQAVDSAGIGLMSPPVAGGSDENDLRCTYGGTDGLYIAPYLLVVGALGFALRWVDSGHRDHRQAGADAMTVGKAMGQNRSWVGPLLGSGRRTLGLERGREKQP